MSRSLDDESVVFHVRNYKEALEAGDHPDRDEILARFPEIADELAACLDGLDFVHRVAPRLRQDKDHELSPALPLGDFKIVREVGRGGMGVVYEAEQMSLGRRVALKVLPFAAVLDSRYLQRFKNEAQAAAHLHHAHIVPVHAIGCDRGVHYYAMQFIEGSTVAALIDELRELPGRALGRDSSPALATLAKEHTAESPQFCRAVARLGMQAADALDYAHESGVIHRDVKPANLIVDAGGHVWITDFGLACTRNDRGLTVTGDIVGTIRYMSPEQALGRRAAVDRRTDVYSLAVTLYEMLTLRQAFPGDNPRRVLQDITSRDPVRPRVVNPATAVELETIVLKAMSKDPADRYPTAADFADDLRRFLEDRPIRARRLSVARRAARWARRHRTAVRAAVAALVLAVVGLTAGVVLLSRERDAWKSEHARADTNFRTARDAVNRMLDRVADELAEHPGTEHLRREILEDALGFYRGFLDQMGVEDSVRFDAADAHRRVGDIYGMLGRNEDARQEYGHAIELFQALAKESPDDPRARYAFAHMFEHLAGIETDPEEAVRTLRRALLLSEELLAEDPARPAYRCQVAHLCQSLGAGLWETDREAAETAYDRAEGLWVALVEEDPTSYENQEGLASILQERAWQLEQRGRFRGAVVAYSRALEAVDKALSRWGTDSRLRARRAQGLLGLGLAFRNTGRFADAEATYRQALALAKGLHDDFPAFPEYASTLGRVYTMLGSTERGLGRAEDGAQLALEAQKIFGELVRVHGDVPSHRLRLARSHVVRGNALGDLGQHSGAEQEFLRCIEVLDGLDEVSAAGQSARVERGVAYGGLASITWRAGTPERSVEWSTKCVAVSRELVADDPGVVDYRNRLADAYRSLAQSLFAVKRPAEAESAFKEAIGVQTGLVDLYPDSASYRFGLARSHNDLALVYRTGGHPSESATEYGKAILILDALGPDQPVSHAYRDFRAWVRNDLSIVLDRNGESALAEKRVREAIAIRNELISDSHEESRSLAETRNHLAGSHRNLAGLLERSGRLPEAEREYETAIRLTEELVDQYPEDATFREAIARSHLWLADILDPVECREDKERHYREALRHRKKLFEDAPTGPVTRTQLGEARTRLADLLWKTGRPDEALAEYREALAVDPENPSLLNQVAWTLATSRPQDAVALAGRAVERAPDNPSYWNTLGFARYRAGEWPGAIEAARRSLDLGNQHPAYDWLVLAMAHMRLGDEIAARKWYGQAAHWIEVHPDDPELGGFATEAAKLLGVAD